MIALIDSHPYSEFEFVFQRSDGNLYFPLTQWNLSDSWKARVAQDIIEYVKTS